MEPTEVSPDTCESNVCVPMLQTYDQQLIMVNIVGSKINLLKQLRTCMHMLNIKSHSPQHKLKNAGDEEINQPTKPQQNLPNPKTD